MRKKYNKKIRLVLSITVCILFVIVSLSNVTGETTTKINSMNQNENIEPVPLFNFRILNRDWNYWTNKPHLFSIPTGNVGIGTSSPYNKLEVYSDTGDAIVYAEATNLNDWNYGGWFISHSYNGTGLRGEGNRYGIQGYTWGHEADAIRGEAHGYNGTGVNGRSYGENGIGVAGQAPRLGVIGSTTGEYSTGVMGYAYGDQGIAVQALAVGINGIAILAEGGEGENGLAGDFWGDVDIQGTLSKGGGSFKIDHPLDPENKYLYHSFVESPDMMNIYNGNIVLDTKGEALVELPEWFTALNKEFRYQLTCIGGYAPVYIAEEITDNKFKIAGGKPNLKISWQVTGIRQDPFAEEYRIPVEKDKQDSERGKYLYPETYGMPKTMSENYIETQNKRFDLNNIN